MDLLTLFTKQNVTHLTLCSLRETADATKALFFGIEV